MAEKTTLQYRLIFLMVIFSIFLIGAFTSIELKNTMDSMSSFNQFRSSLGAHIARNALLGIVPGMRQLPEERAKKLVVETLDPFVIAEILDGVSVLVKGKEVSLQDKQRFDEICRTGQNRWLYGFIDKPLNQTELYISFYPDNQYVVKLTYSLGNIQEAFKKIYNPIIVTVILVLAANVVFATILSRIIILPIQALNSFTRTVAGGNLEAQVNIGTGDELEELGSAFNHMTNELRRMKDRAENANPLTKLPGNIVIMEEVERRIKGGEKFVVFYSDLDNFKAFNDKYGIHKGDEAIKMTSDIMREAVRDKGNPDDLIGHEGGDDFVIVTTPDRANDVGQAIVDIFTSKVRDLYDPNDLGQGYFIARDREGNVRKFPIMGVSLAGVSNEKQEVKSYAELTNICAYVKKKVKAQEGSVYCINVEDEGGH
ncbi:MAG: diguanylate cyclase [Candidatus Omnitrophota bacterium]